MLAKAFPLRVFQMEELFTLTIGDAGLLNEMCLVVTEGNSLLSSDSNPSGAFTLDDPHVEPQITSMLIASLPSKWPYLAWFDDLKSVLSVFEARDTEFCFTRTFHPAVIDAVCYNGFFPMSVPMRDNVYAFAIKVSYIRCVMDPNQLHVSKSTKKRAQYYQITVDKDFDQVVALTVQIKGENWLCPRLSQSFKEMHQKKELYKTKLHSIEVWEGDKLVAGELGYVVGSIYTSLTGFYVDKGCGSVQLCATGKLLHQLGFTHWDFEMSHKYKLDLGAKEYQRREWVPIQAKHRDNPTLLTCPSKNTGKLLSE